MYLLHQQLKSLPHVIARLCTHFQVRHFVFPCQILPFFSTNLSLIVEICFSSQQHFAYISRSIIFDLIDPSINVLKRSAVYNRVGEYNSCSSFVVGLSNIFEPFLPCSIPYLQSVPPVTYSDSFDFEIDSNGCHVGLLEGAFTVASNEYSFSDSAVADDDDFGHEIVLVDFIGRVHWLLQKVCQFLRNWLIAPYQHNRNSISDYIG